MNNEEKRLEDLKAGNATLEISLKRDGVGITDLGVMQLHLQALKRTVIGDDEELRLKFDITYQECLRKALEDVSTEYRKARLLQGVNGSPGPVPPPHIVDN